MKTTYQQAMDILITLNGVHQQILSKEKYKKIPKNLLYALWLLSKQENNKVSISELIENFLKKHPGLNKQVLEVKFSKILKLAIEHDFLNKSNDKNDNRIKYFSISIQGKKILNEIREKAERLWDIANEK